MLTQKRAKNVAVTGALLQLGFTIVMLVIGLKTRSLAAMSCTWFLAGGVGLWSMVAMLFYCRQLERREAIELEELSTGDSAKKLFRAEDQAQLRPAAMRAKFMQRWGIPIFTIVWAGYHVAIGILVLRYLGGRGPAELLHAAPATLFSVLIAFLAFLFSNYALGMSRREEWRWLRATGSYLLVNTLWIVGVAGSLLAARGGYPRVDRIIGYVFPLAQLVLATELLMNLLLNVYRPRIPGGEHRPSFDSRLFNLIAQPGRVGHSIAEAVNYQFGFEVSKTWFYRLVSRAFVPLLIFGAAVLVGISSIVIVHEGEQGVVLRWGRIDETRSTLRAGIHFKRPFPIDSARKFRVDRVHEILLGAGERREATYIKGREVRLWTEEHSGHEEKDFLIAVPPHRVSQSQEQQAPPVSIIKLVVVVYYVIDDVKKYAFNYANPDKLLECVAYREMVRYCATATLDEKIDAGAGEGASDRPEAIITVGRARAAKKLKERIEQAVGEDGLDLGVKITHLGILAAHPPAGAALAFEEVLQVERRRDGQIYEAEAEANAILSQVAGSPETALRLAFAIRRVEELEKLQERKSDPEQFEDAADEFIARVQRDLRTTDEEIERERLLGQLRPDRLTFRQEFRESYRRHLEMLKQGRTNRVTYDYTDQLRDAYRKVDELFARTSGEPAALVALAGAERWKKELDEKARAEAFQRQIEAYQASPTIYTLDRWLGVLEEALPRIRKYILTVDRDKVEIRLDLEDKGTGLIEPFETPQEGETK